MFNHLREIISKNQTKILEIFEKGEDFLFSEPVSKFPLPEDPELAEFVKKYEGI